MNFGVKPDVHHIRKFDSLAYAHVPVTLGRRKHDRNAKLDYVLGYTKNVVGYKVYFPSEHTAKFMSDLRVAEEVVYRDRHEVDEESADWSSLNFSMEEQDENSGVANVDTEKITVAESMTVNDPNRDESLKLEESEDEVLQEDETDDVLQESEDPVYGDEGVAGGERLHYPVNEAACPSTGEVDQVAEDLHTSQDEETEEHGSNMEAVDGEGNESVAGTCGSSIVAEGPEGAKYDGNASDKDVTVASVFCWKRERDGRSHGHTHRKCIRPGRGHGRSRCI